MNWHWPGKTAHGEWLRGELGMATMTRGINSLYIVEYHIWFICATFNSNIKQIVITIVLCICCALNAFGHSTRRSTDE